MTLLLLLLLPSSLYRLWRRLDLPSGPCSQKLSACTLKDVNLITTYTEQRIPLYAKLFGPT